MGSLIAPSVGTPPARNITQEMNQTYAGYANTAQPYFNLESIFDPKYGQINLDKTRQNLFGYDVPQGGTPAAGAPQPAAHAPGTLGLGGYTRDPKGRLRPPGTLGLGGGNHTYTDPYYGTTGPSQTPGHHPGMLEMGAQANTFNRGRDVSDVARYGPAATQAFLAANPYLHSGLDNVLGRMQDSPLLASLNQQAQSALASGGALSPQEIRDLSQQTQAGFASRGLNQGNQSLAADLLTRDSAVRSRMAAAQQLASGVQGLNQQQNDFVGRGSQIFSSTLSDPFQAILGRTSGAGGGGGGGGGYPQQIGTGAQLFNPTNPYAQDLYNTNYNAQAASRISNANNQAATNSALISATGAIIGGALSDERIKKEIKDTGEKTASGIPIKTWVYKTDRQKRRFRGVMAGDVKRVAPHAVLTDPISGLEAVNYSAIDAPFDFVTGKLRKAA